MNGRVLILTKVNLFLDTHVVVWLCIGDKKALSKPAISALEKFTRVFLSSTMLLELEYLYEIGKLTVQVDYVLDIMKAQFGAEVSNPDFGQLIKQARHEKWTRDVFDRLLVAEAKLEGASILTKDRKIRENYLHSVW